METINTFFSGTNIVYLDSPKGYSDKQIELIKLLYDLEITEEVYQFLAECGRYFRINAHCVLSTFCGSGDIRELFVELYLLRHRSNDWFSDNAIVLAYTGTDYNDYVLELEGNRYAVTIGPVAGEENDYLHMGGPKRVGSLKDFFIKREQDARKYLIKNRVFDNKYLRPNSSGMLCLRQKPLIELDEFDVCSEEKLHPADLFGSINNMALAAGFTEEELTLVENLYDIYVLGQLREVLLETGRKLMGFEAAPLLTLFSSNLVMKHHLMNYAESVSFFESHGWKTRDMSKNERKAGSADGLLVIGKDGNKRYVLHTFSSERDAVYEYDLKAITAKPTGLNLIEFLTQHLKPAEGKTLRSCLLTVTRDQAIIEKYKAQ